MRHACRTDGLLEKGAMLGAPVSDQLKCIDQAKLAGNVILQSYARARAWLKMLNLG